MKAAAIVGGCLCGAIRYSSSADCALTAVCHCRDCQKQTGTAFSVLLGIPRTQLDVSGSSLRQTDTPGSSGMKVSRAFCGLCGSPIFSDAASTPDLLWLKAGTLDDTSQLAPELHLWCETAQPWLSIKEGEARHLRNPP